VNVVHRYHSRCSIPSEFQGSELEKKQNRHTYGPELIMSCVLPNLLCDNCSTTNALVPPRFVVPSVRVFFPPNDGWWLGLPAAGFQSGANRATPPDSCALALWPPRIFFYYLSFQLRFFCCSLAGSPLVLLWTCTRPGRYI
jgi:hypothetical protein